MNKLTPLALLLLLLLPPVTAVNVWEHINTSREMYFVKVLGRCRREPPLDPLNNSRIASVSIGYAYSDTQYIITYYAPYDSEYCKHTGRCGWWEEFLPKQENLTPFNFSIWNVTKVLEEYHWGLENYLPNITGKVTDDFEWPEKYWVRRADLWEVWIDASEFRVTLYSFVSEIGGLSYVVFECQNPENMTCNWKEPVVDVEVMVPPTTTATTKKPEDKEICGPALLVGLVLFPLLVKQKKR
ncbi:CGP-CTERM sorting domain-containing protein [Thermococcus sp. MV11]|uniref:CGP-CTERM sorting domain-containing protein n=1 Tax=Thermococcus sp. MV11 TaxID=1638267 RepID=UPI0014309879|nr:CGP-CTERM sorting domain-containing protein [Thermococcus sp. MV11]